MKMCKNGDFRHISGIFGWKKVFLKNRSRSCFGHCYCAFLNKKSVKTNDEISRKHRKTEFSGIFGRKNTFLENRAPSYFRYSHFACVQNFMKKYKVQLEKFKKYRFSMKICCSGRFLESSSYKNQFY